MKRAVAVLMLFSILIVTILMGCHNQDVSQASQDQGIKNQFQIALMEWSQITEGELPENLCLKIYYMYPDVDTRVPLSAEEIKNHSNTKTITVDSQRLEPHLETLRKLNLDNLQFLAVEPYINTRLCYVFEWGDNEPLLEVVFGGVHNSVHINGVVVANDPLLFGLIDPFLSDEAKECYGYYKAT